jgi:hypothetical protein
MFSLDAITRTASAAILALVLTTVLVGAAVGPIGGGAQAPAAYAAVASGGVAHG